ncbi:MAG TPA: ferritin-like domain-containing protein [Bdellovibrionales bacterium]|jgi:bacterioferritin|nr:ferritin-like domain-containing protein [Bdellovibrionales bacterium]
MNEPKNDLYDIEKVRQHARHSIENGPVTQDYPLDLDQACALLNEALATEIMCVLRYRHHEVAAKGITSEEIAAEFAEHAVSEERHMMMLARRIDQLGGNPELDPMRVADRAITEYGNASDIRAMLEDDLVAERIVIEVYRKMIEWFGTADPTTRRMLEKILKDEEEHADDLADLLATDATSLTFM